MVEANGVKKVKPEHWGIGAIIVAVLTGGGGLGLNMSSNKEVINKLETLTLTMVEFKGAIKASDDRNSRLEAKVEKNDDTLDKLRVEVAELRQRIGILEVKVK